MLEFIVLGQIPGTNIQINFTTLLASIPALLLMGEAALFLRRRSKLQASVKTAKVAN